MYALMVQILCHISSLSMLARYASLGQDKGKASFNSHEFAFALNLSQLFLVILILESP